jgi:cellulase
MKAATLFLIAGSTALVKGHATVYNIWINDANQGLGNSASGYIRSPPNNDPIKNLTSNSLRCNVNNVPTSKTLLVSGGDKVGDSLLRS